ncbi:GFA family protein [Phyllobacterium sp. YR531]|uniref:GFA family protein n=1 Tax=Phyllobacterium sp. YR531 TaxID=1144343 RepID=UPI00026F8760|nr:GFA family protein [Phyllobacterium sp. YR531]EJN01720.1 hypothetical protein PMI41_03436 [Phyllobacterium sp. YR531]
MPGKVSGSCHCGIVCIEIATVPEELNDCQCEHCQKRGALWAYFPVDQVMITGTTSYYCWSDKGIEFHFCSSCGCTTHWAPVDPTYNRMAVNARVFGKAIFQKIPQRKGAGPS